MDRLLFVGQEAGWGFRFVNDAYWRID